LRLGEIISGAKLVQARLLPEQAYLAQLSMAVCAPRNECDDAVRRQ
jgi:hypothetical protein